jgi:dephospho-CoA kinase
MSSLPLAPLRLGLTGGIGSGKSTVANMLVMRGAALIDADAIARQVTAPKGPALAMIAKQFGAHLITDQGALDRDKMRELVFRDPASKKTLEAIIHPLVGQETQRQAQVAVETGYQTVVFDVPLLVESGRWRGQVDKVLVVDCLVETQVQRVIARSGLTAEAIQRIIQAQADRLQRLACADWVIFNEQLTLEQLRAEVVNLPL